MLFWIFLKGSYQYFFHLSAETKTSASKASNISRYSAYASVLVQVSANSSQAAQGILRKLDEGLKYILSKTEIERTALKAASEELLKQLADLRSPSVAVTVGRSRQILVLLKDNTAMVLNRSMILPSL